MTDYLMRNSSLNTVKEVMTTVPPGVVSSISAGTLKTITGHIWFPKTIAPAFMNSMHDVFYVGFGITLFAGIISLFRKPFNVDDASEKLEDQENR